AELKVFVVGVFFGGEVFAVHRQHIAHLDVRLVVLKEGKGTDDGHFDKVAGGEGKDPRIARIDVIQRLAVAVHEVYGVFDDKTPFAVFGAAIDEGIVIGKVQPDPLRKGREAQ